MRSASARTGADVSPRRPADHAVATVTPLRAQPGPTPPPVTDLSVIVPAYNEQDRLGPTLARICGYFAARHIAWEVIVVDDGSRDATADLVRAAAAAEPRIRLVSLVRNHGKGFAVREGVRACAGDRILICDADLSTPIEELERLWTLSPGAVGAIGSRSDPARIGVHQHRLRELLGRLGNLAIRRMAKLDVADSQCGFKLFEGFAARELFARAAVDRWSFDVEILHLCARLGWRVDEVPVAWSHVPGSKIRASAYLPALIAVATLRLRHRRVSRSDPRRPVAVTDLTVLDRLVADRAAAEVA
jgi:dolichyl-phosphate beta-glucosyltransferase